MAIISHVVPQVECRQAFCKLSVMFVPLPHFCPPKNKSLKNEKKNTPTDIIILLTLRCLINVGVKTDVGVRDFS